MENLIKKWYFSLILLPIGINVITTILTPQSLFQNSEYTIIGILTILCLILIYELAEEKKKDKVAEFKPKEGDKKKILDLIETLNLSLFQETIKEQNGWYGYPRMSIQRCIDFTDKARSITYRTSDENLNLLIKGAADAIDDFTDYSSKNLYPEKGYYLPAKDSEFQRERSKISAEVMNLKASIAFEKVSELMEYSRSRNYLD